METKEQKQKNEVQETLQTVEVVNEEQPRPVEQESAEQEPTEQEPAEQEPTQRERLMARMRSAKPQRSWADEEEFFKAINDDYDEQEILQELYDEQARDHQLTMEAAVAAAAHEGEVRGRNLKIEEELRRIRQPEHIHNLSGSPMGATGRYADRPELGALNRVGYQSIWERGREVRTKN